MAATRLRGTRMPRHRLLAALFAPWLFAPWVAGAALAAEPEPPLALATMGSFHLGGREVTVSGKPAREVQLVPGSIPARIDPNGTYQAEAMYVQYHDPRRAARPGAAAAVAWRRPHRHDLGDRPRTGARAGSQFFLRRGWATYVSDAVERGRAGFAMSPGDLRRRAHLPDHRRPLGALPHRRRPRQPPQPHPAAGQPIPGRGLRRISCARWCPAGPPTMPRRWLPTRRCWTGWARGGAGP